MKEIIREMKDIEEKQREFEKQGREIELLIRDRDKGICYVLLIKCYSFWLINLLTLCKILK